MKTLIAFLLISTSLCAAPSFSSGGGRSMSFSSSSRSMSMSSTRVSSTSSFKSSSSTGSSVKFSTASGAAYKAGSSYKPSSFKNYSYRPSYYNNNSFGVPFSPLGLSYGSPLNNVWFWMYMTSPHNNGSVFANNNNSLEKWDGNATEEETKDKDFNDACNVILITTGIVFIVILVVFFVWK